MVHKYDQANVAILDRLKARLLAAPTHTHTIHPCSVLLVQSGTGHIHMDTGVTWQCFTSSNLKSWVWSCSVCKTSYGCSRFLLSIAMQAIQLLPELQLRAFASNGWQDLPCSGIQITTSFPAMQLCLCLYDPILLFIFPHFLWFLRFHIQFAYLHLNNSISFITIMCYSFTILVNLHLFMSLVTISGHRIFWPPNASLPSSNLHTKRLLTSCIHSWYVPATSSSTSSPLLPLRGRSLIPTHGGRCNIVNG